MAFSTGEVSGGKGLSSEINVTPLIDVLLVLLIIFMVIVPVAPLGLEAALPSSSSGAVREESERPVFVQVEQRGADLAYSIDGVGLDRSEVAARLVELLGRRAVRQVLLKADPRLDFGVVSGVIDDGRAAGAERIALITPGALARP